MDIIRSADHIIDIGPEGGRRGGEILTTGTPADVAKFKGGHTGFHLNKELKSLGVD